MCVLVGAPASRASLDGSEHGLLVMLEDESQNLDHLAVAARRLEHALLQSPEGRREFGERRAVAECAPGLRWMTAR